MEAFSLLKYWRGGGGLGVGVLSSSDPASPTPKATTTILTAVAQTENATDSDTDDGDDGPFFDLEFAVPDEVDDSEIPNANHSHSGRDSDNHSQEEEEEDDDDDDDNIEESEGDNGEREFKFTLSPSSNDRNDPNLSLSLSPSDDLFFKGKLVPSSFEPNSKPQFTTSLLKSATKFRVFMLGLKKSKSNITASDKDSNASDSATPNPKQPETQQPESQKKQPERKFFTVKFKVEEVPIMSLFTRDNSSRGNNNKSQNQKHNSEESPASSDEKRFPKEVMQKYLKMVKPLYIRVSRRYGDKLGFSGHLNLSSEAKVAPPPATAEKKAAPVKPVVEKAQTEADGATEGAGSNSKSQKQGNLPAGLRVVCKHLGKSRSASSAVAAVPPPALLSSKRRDDSLLQQQDGIQGAILHCKRSFNASRECESSSRLPRSVSDPLQEMPSDLSRKSTNEGKDKRL